MLNSGIINLVRSSIPIPTTWLPLMLYWRSIWSIWGFSIVTAFWLRFWNAPLLCRCILLFGLLNHICIEIIIEGHLALFLSQTVFQWHKLWVAELLFLHTLLTIYCNCSRLLLAFIYRLIHLTNRFLPLRYRIFEFK